MPDLQRNSVVQRGPRFFERGGEVMFEHILDGSTRFGPRVATDADLAAHPEAFAAMGEEPAINPAPVTYVEPETAHEAPPRPHAERRRAAAS